LIRIYGRYTIREAATRIGGLFQWENDPGYGDPNRWRVLATSQDALTAKVAEEQNQEADRRDHEAEKRREAEQQREAHLQAKHQKVISDLQVRGGDMEQCWEMAGE
jgi:hypothetical protein